MSYKNQVFHVILLCRQTLLSVWFDKTFIVDIGNGTGTETGSAKSKIGIGNEDCNAFPMRLSFWWDLLCLWTYFLHVKLIPQRVHTKSFEVLWIGLCRVKSHRTPKPFPQISQKCFFSPVCMVKCPNNCCLNLNLFGQKVHSCGKESVCIFRWMHREAIVLKAFPQVWQT